MEAGLPIGPLHSSGLLRAALTRAYTLGAPRTTGILAAGATVIVLLLTIRRDTRADNLASRAEVRADLADLRMDV